MVNLNVKIGKLKLKNPVMVASGTFGPEYGELININKLGAYVAKTITLEKRTGNSPPRVAETPSGMLNSIGLENGGLEDFIKNKLIKLKNIKIPVIASIAGDDAAEFSVLAKRLSNVRKVAAIEVNLSCPNLSRRSSLVASLSCKSGIIAQDEKMVYKIVNEIRKVTDTTIIAKLSPNVTDITKIAKTAESAGADAVLIANTHPAMAVDIETKKSMLGNISGGLSGPAIKPIVLKLICDAFNNVKIPIIGCGGIMDYKDAIEFILCGASAIQVGTANFVNPDAAIEIIDGIKKYMMREKAKDINGLVGALREK